MFCVLLIAYYQPFAAVCKSREKKNFIFEGRISVSIDRSFVNRRLHSLLGVLPIGLFLMMHLYTNFYLTKGEEAFGEKVKGIS